MDDPQPDGVYYRKEDCVGALRRLLIDAVDICTLMVLSVFAVVFAVSSFPAEGRLLGPLFLMFVWFGYLVILKRSGVGTLGFLICGAKVVDMSGGTPGVGALLQRAFVALAGIFALFAEYSSAVSDPHRRSIRDRVSGTYLITRNAQPAGTGQIVLSPMMFMGMSFVSKGIAAIGESQ